MPPHIHPDCVSIFNQYVVSVENRDGVQQALSLAGVSTEIYYPRPLHLQECFSAAPRGGRGLPAAESAANHVLALPIYPELTPEMLDNVADALIQACSAASADSF